MNSKIIDKIKKLLSLSKSDNEHEAANAAAAAAGLMAQHQISIATLGEDDGDTIDDTLGTFYVDNSASRKVVWKGSIAFGVAASFGCQYYWSGPHPTMVGRKGDVDAVKYIYAYLVREVNRLAEKSWDEYPLKDYESARAYKTSFRTGATLIVRKRLQESRKENLSNEKVNADELKMNAIVKVEANDEAIKEFYKDLSKGFGRFNASNTVSSLSGLNAGKKAGNSINLGNNKGLNGGSNKLGKPTKMLGN